MRQPKPPSLKSISKPPSKSSDPGGCGGTVQPAAASAWAPQRGADGHSAMDLGERLRSLLLAEQKISVAPRHLGGNRIGSFRFLEGVARARSIAGHLIR